MFVPKGGASPELFFLGEHGEELEKIDLSTMNQEECNQLLVDRGFVKKASKEEQLPEEVTKKLYYKRADEL